MAERLTAEQLQELLKVVEHWYGCCHDDPAMEPSEVEEIIDEALTLMRERDEARSENERLSMKVEQYQIQLEDKWAAHIAGLNSANERAAAARKALRELLTFDLFDFDAPVCQSEELEAALKKAREVLGEQEPEEEHPADCLCDGCVTVVKGKCYYRDGREVLGDE